MDFIERLFVIAPDADNGLLEFSFVLSVVVTVTGLVLRRMIRMIRESRNPVRV